MADGRKHFPEGPHLDQVWYMGLVGHQSGCGDWTRVGFLACVGNWTTIPQFFSSQPRHLGDQVIRARFVTIMFMSAVGLTRSA